MDSPAPTRGGSSWQQLAGRTRRLPGGRHRLWPVGLLAGIRLKEAGIPFTIVRRTRTSAAPGTRTPIRAGCRVDVGNHFYCYSFEPADHWTEYFAQQPELQRYFRGVMDKHEIGPSVRWSTEVVSAVWDDTAGVWHVDDPPAGAADGSQDEVLTARAVISAVGPVEPPQAAGHPGTRVVRRAVVPLGAVGPLGPTSPASVWRSSEPARAASRSLRRSPTGSSTSPSSSGRRSGCSRTRTTTRRSVRVSAGRCGTSPGTEAGTASCCSGRDATAASVRHVSTRRGPISGAVGSRDERHHPPDLHRLDHEPGRQRSRPRRQGRAGLPRHGQAPPPQDNGSWLRTLTRPDVDLVRTGIERIESDAIVTVDGERHEVDVIVFATASRPTSSCGRCRSSGATAGSCPSSGAMRPSAYLGITVRVSPTCSACTGPGRTSRTGSLIFHSECQMRYIAGCIDALLDRAPPAWSHVRTSTTPTRNATNGSSRGWSGRVRTSRTPGTGAARRQDPRPQPVALVDYWNWTKEPDLDDFVVR